MDWKNPTPAASSPYVYQESPEGADYSPYRLGTPTIKRQHITGPYEAIAERISTIQNYMSPYDHRSGISIFVENDPNNPVGGETAHIWKANDSIVTFSVDAVWPFPTPYFEFVPPVSMRVKDDALSNIISLENFANLPVNRQFEAPAAIGLTYHPASTWYAASYQISYSLTYSGVPPQDGETFCTFRTDFFESRDVPPDAVPPQDHDFPNSKKDVDSALNDDTYVVGDPANGIMPSMPYDGQVRNDHIYDLRHAATEMIAGNGYQYDPSARFPDDNTGNLARFAWAPHDNKDTSFMLGVLNKGTAKLAANNMQYEPFTGDTSSIYITSRAIDKARYVIDLDNPGGPLKLGIATYDTESITLDTFTNNSRRYLAAYLAKPKGRISVSNEIRPQVAINGFGVPYYELFWHDSHLYPPGIEDSSICDVIDCGSHPEMYSWEMDNLSIDLAPTGSSILNEGVTFEMDYLSWHGVLERQISGGNSHLLGYARYSVFKTEKKNFVDALQFSDFLGYKSFVTRTWNPGVSDKVHTYNISDHLCHCSSGTFWYGMNCKGTTVNGSFNVPSCDSGATYSGVLKDFEFGVTAPYSVFCPPIGWISAYSNMQCNNICSCSQKVIPSFPHNEYFPYYSGTQFSIISADVHSFEDVVPSHYKMVLPAGISSPQDDEQWPQPLVQRFKGNYAAFGVDQYVSNYYESGPAGTFDLDNPPQYNDLGVWWSYERLRLQSWTRFGDFEFIHGDTTVLSPDQPATGIDRAQTSIPGFYSISKYDRTETLIDKSPYSGYLYLETIDDYPYQIYDGKLSSDGNPPRIPDFSLIKDSGFIFEREVTNINTHQKMSGQGQRNFSMYTSYWLSDQDFGAHPYSDNYMFNMSYQFWPEAKGFTCGFATWGNPELGTDVDNPEVNLNTAYKLMSTNFARSSKMVWNGQEVSNIQCNHTDDSLFTAMYFPLTLRDETDVLYDKTLAELVDIDRNYVTYNYAVPSFSGYSLKLEVASAAGLRIGAVLTAELSNLAGSYFMPITSVSDYTLYFGGEHASESGTVGVRFIEESTAKNPVMYEHNTEVPIAAASQVMETTGYLFVAFDADPFVTGLPSKVFEPAYLGWNSTSGKWTLDRGTIPYGTYNGGTLDVEGYTYNPRFPISECKLLEGERPSGADAFDSSKYCNCNFYSVRGYTVGYDSAVGVLSLDLPAPKLVAIPFVSNITKSLDITSYATDWVMRTGKVDFGSPSSWLAIGDSLEVNFVTRCLQYYGGCTESDSYTPGLCPDQHWDACPHYTQSLFAFGDTQGLNDYRTPIRNEHVEEVRRIIAHPNYNQVAFGRSMATSLGYDEGQVDEPEEIYGVYHLRSNSWQYENNHINNEACCDAQNYFGSGCVATSGALISLRSGDGIPETPYLELLHSYSYGRTIYSNEAATFMGCYCDVTSVASAYNQSWVKAKIRPESGSGVFGYSGYSPASAFLHFRYSSYYNSVPVKGGTTSHTDCYMPNTDERKHTYAGIGACAISKPATFTMNIPHAGGSSTLHSFTQQASYPNELWGASDLFNYDVGASIDIEMASYELATDVVSRVYDSFLNMFIPTFDDYMGNKMQVEVTTRLDSYFGYYYAYHSYSW